MNHGRAKKKVAWRLFQHADLARASAFHATSESEASAIRDLGFKQPIAVIPNGVTSPVNDNFKRQTDRKRCLFLSRIHPVKGLTNLLHAWKQSNPPSEWQLLIAGPDETGHVSELQKLANDLGISESVEFRGPVDDEDKWKLYQSAGFLILPSFSENFGIVVAEALLSGTPVITTTGTPWQGLKEHQCGWWVEPTVDALSDAIGRASSTPNDDLVEMGLAGRRWMQSEYQWTSVAERMSRFYGWLLQRDGRPDFVI